MTTIAIEAEETATGLKSVLHFLQKRGWRVSCWWGRNTSEERTVDVSGWMSV